MIMIINDMMVIIIIMIILNFKLLQIEIPILLHINDSSSN